MSLLYKTVLFFAAVFLLQGCGYTLNHLLKDTFTYEKGGIFIPVFTNNTDETGAEMVFTNALIHELEGHGETMTNSKIESGIQIHGVVNDIQQKTAVFAPTGYKGSHGSQFKGLQSYARIPDQIGVTVTLTLELLDTKTQKVRWRTTVSRGRSVSAPLNRVADQDAPSSLGPITQSLIESVYPDIAREMMRDIYDSMVDI